MNDDVDALWPHFAPFWADYRATRHEPSPCGAAVLRPPTFIGTSPPQKGYGIKLSEAFTRNDAQRNRA